MGSSIDKRLSIKVFALLALSGTAVGIIATAPPRLSAVSKPDSGASRSSVDPNLPEAGSSSFYSGFESDLPTLKRVAPTPDKDRKVSV
jgi:hypothetical protein